MTDQNNITESTSKVSWVLSLGGFVPFICLASALVLVGSEQELFQPLFDIFKTWSAVILSFLGGIRWGFAISKSPEDRSSLVFSVVPPILGWLALFLPNAYTVLVLLLLYCAQGAWDSLFVSAGNAPQWFGKIRITMTFLVAAAHIMVFFAAVVS